MRHPNTKGGVCPGHAHDTQVTHLLGALGATHDRWFQTLSSHLGSRLDGGEVSRTHPHRVGCECDRSKEQRQSEPAFPSRDPWEVLKVLSSRMVLARSTQLHPRQGPLAWERDSPL